jgi:hypothetical protein
VERRRGGGNQEGARGRSSEVEQLEGQSRLLASWRILSSRGASQGTQGLATLLLLQGHQGEELQGNSAQSAVRNQSTPVRDVARGSAAESATTHTVRLDASSLRCNQIQEVQSAVLLQLPRFYSL